MNCQMLITAWKPARPSVSLRFGYVVGVVTMSLLGLSSQAWSQIAVSQKTSVSANVFPSPETQDDILKSKVIYESPSTHKLIVRSTMTDRSQSERVANYQETQVFKEKNSKDPNLQVLDITDRDIPDQGKRIYGFGSGKIVRSESDKSESEQSQDIGVNWGIESLHTDNPTDSGIVSNNSDTYSSQVLEDQLEIPLADRNKKGRQCSEYTSPDGSYSEKNCSQVWSWKSKD